MKCRSAVFIAAIIAVVVGWWLITSLTEEGGSGSGAGSAVEDPDDNRVMDMINGKTDGVVMFYADWCSHCQKMKPTFKETAEEAPLPCLLANGDKCPESTENLRIEGYPAVFKIVGGKVTPYTGDRSKESLDAFVRS